MFLSSLCAAEEAELRFSEWRQFAHITVKTINLYKLTLTDCFNKKGQFATSARPHLKRENKEESGKVPQLRAGKSLHLPVK